MKFGSRRYRATIIEFLEWQPRKRRRKGMNTCAGEQPLRSSAKKNEASKGSTRNTKASKSSTAKKSTASKRSPKAIKPLWLGSGSPAKSSTQAPPEDQATSRTEARVVLGEITNTSQHHGIPSSSPKVHNSTSTPPPLSEHDHSGTPPPLSEHDHSGTPLPHSQHKRTNQPTPLSSSSSH